MKQPWPYDFNFVKPWIVMVQDYTLEYKSLVWEEKIVGVATIVADSRV